MQLFYSISKVLFNIVNYYFKLFFFVLYMHTDMHSVIVRKPETLVNVFNSTSHEIFFLLRHFLPPFVPIIFQISLFFIALTIP